MGRISQNILREIEEGECEWKSKKFSITELYAVYEKVPAHGSKINNIILAPFDTEKEAEEARIKYGYGGDNYYISKIK